MDAKIFQFPDKRKAAGQDVVDPVQMIFENAAQKAWVQAGDDAVHLLKVKDPVRYAQISTDPQISCIAFVAALILEHAAVTMRLTMAKPPQRKG